MSDAQAHPATPPPRLACTAEPPTAPPPRTGPPPRLPPGPRGTLPGGNPRGDPTTAPRCGARTRAGCPCQAPAIRGKTRCRLHGGGSTGARTPQGLQRLRAAATTHGHYGGASRAHKRFILTFLRRGRVHLQLWRYADLLPPELRARLSLAPELQPPPRPAGPHATLSRAQDRALARAEAAALAPWKAAIRQAQAARREGQAPHAPWPASPPPPPKAPAPAAPAERRPPPPAAPPPRAAAPGVSAPHAPWRQAADPSAACPKPPPPPEPVAGPLGATPAATPHAPWQPRTALAPQAESPAPAAAAVLGESVATPHAPWAASAPRRAEPPRALPLRRRLLASTRLSSAAEQIARQGGLVRATVEQAAREVAATAPPALRQALAGLGLG